MASAATSEPVRPSLRMRSDIASPSSPRTPLLGRSISSQFGSPGSFRTEQEDHLVYELGARHFSAGFAGESRPRCVLGFGPELGRRAGDYRQHEPGYRRKQSRRKDEDEGDAWSAGHRLYSSHLRDLDLGLVQDKLDRVLRTVHADHLQLDTSKSRKAMLVVPPLLPTPLLEVVLKVLFGHFTQPPSVTVLNTPALACVGAGVRHGLVVDVGWEETVVTAVGEYKEIFQRRSVRAGKRLTSEIARMLDDEVEKQTGRADRVSFEHAEDVTQRLAWCRPRIPSSSPGESDPTTAVAIPVSSTSPSRTISLPFSRLSDPVESTLFSSSSHAGRNEDDDHETPIHSLAYAVLLALPPDQRALCTSRIILTGGLSNLPGLKTRLLDEISSLVRTRGWDKVRSYGSASSAGPRRTDGLRERSANVGRTPQRPRSAGGDDGGDDDGTADEDRVALSPAKKPIQDAVPHGERIHDDAFDPITLKAEREAGKGRVDVVRGVVRGVNTLGAWSGASMLASLRVKGTWEVEREEFSKHGLDRDMRT